MKKIKLRVLSVFFSCLTLLSCLSIPAFAAGAEENLTQNPSFEQGMEHWQHNAPFDSVVPTLSSDSRSGNSSLLLNRYSLIQSQGVYQAVTLPKAGEYEFTAYVKHTSSEDVTAILRLGDKEKPFTVPAN